MSNAAVFDLNQHAIVAGWASYTSAQRAHEHITAPAPNPANGYSPSNYARCACGVMVKWYVIGQHRYGSLSKASDLNA